ncbi:MAG: hypothetical protein JRJ86_15745 [Deltaproteobacteria bacterium]|nr:hypothetical protein [Deltaproteobacteria bacterium]
MTSLKLREENRRWKPPQSVFHYKELAEEAKYAWVDDFLIKQELREKLRSLVEEEKKIIGLPLLKKDLLDRLRKSYEKIEAHQAEGLLDFLLGQRNEPDPLARFQQYVRSPVLHWMDPLPSLNKLERAVARMPEGEISGREREKALRKIGEEITSLRSRLELVRIANSFVESWKDVQSRISAPCNPFGVELEKSSRAETKAWNKLGLQELINPDVPFLPHPGIRS